MCTRCVRFTREITQTGELQVMRRGNHAEIDVFPGHPVDNPLAGNVVDLCPVGALLDKDFLHKQRVWFLSQARLDLHPLLDRLQHQRRGEPGPALAVQAAVQPARQRLLDLRRGPVQLQGRQRPRPARRRCTSARGTTSAPSPVDEALTAVDRGPDARSPSEGGIVAGVLSPFLTVEEAYLMASLPQGPEPGERAGARARCPSRGDGPDVHARPDQGADRRHQLRRPPAVHDPRREVPEPPGRRGGPRALPGRGDRLRRARPAGRRGRVPGRSTSPPTRSTPGSTRPRAQALRAEGRASWSSRTRTVTPLAQLADVVLAGATFAEKAGCYVNADGRLQYSEAALPPRDGSLPDLDLFAILLDRPRRPGPLARGPRGAGRGRPGVRRRPRGARSPRSASSLGERRARRRRRRVAAFADAWYVPQGAARDRRRPGEPATPERRRDG